MVKWQLGETNRLLDHALRHCPGHAEAFKGSGFKGRLSNLEELVNLPFFTKDQLREDYLKFTAKNYTSNTLKPITSGGTTGTPTRFMVNSVEYDAVFDAWRHAMWRRVGYSTRSRALDLTWAFSEKDIVTHSTERKHTFLSIHALDYGAIATWWQRVMQFRPEFIIAFPSTVAALAKLLPEPGALPQVRAILLASETLTSDQQSLISTAFPHARIFQWYGMSEMAGFASGCKYGDTFHHWPQSGVMELIDHDGRVVKEPGGVGEIVLTGFLNYATPFIRYRTGDRGVLGVPCAGCGQSFTVLSSIEGRLADYLVSKNGRLVTISALNFHSDEFRHVFSHQFIQEIPGIVKLLVVPMSGFSEIDFAAIKKLISDRIGYDISVKIEIVASIPRTPRGKQQLIVQRCALPEGFAGISVNSLSL